MKTNTHPFRRALSRIGLFSLAVLITIGLVACNGEPEPDPEPEDPATIVDIAMADERFSTLVTAVDSAGLVDVLEQEGPYTVFAPTNQAFDELPEGTLEELLDAENRERLRDILTFHVAEGNLGAPELQDTTSVLTLQGSEVPIRVEDGELFVGEALVVQPGVTAGNGVIHAIDGVLMPPEDENDE